MNLSRLDDLLWVAGFIGHALLATVLVSKGRWRQFPIFTSSAVFQVLLTAGLFVSYRQNYKALYFWIFWLSSVLDLLFQLGIMYEIARAVLRPTGTWVRDASKAFLSWGLAGALVAVALSFAISPSASSAVQAWIIRANLFTSLLIAELFVAMMFSAHRLGLVWRNHVMGLGQGLGMWALVSLFVGIADSYFGWAQIYKIDYARTFAYLGALVYWTITFWLPEPERKPLSPEMRDYLLALHEKVSYDLSTVRSARNSR
ncbi:hypothetical protein [Acidipila rosea]|uniref:Uncharacterized protein n=1 Tax=Acidipila rosea TaxID=768535 RepID=A0A4R1KZ26_9BACT|nr:hypothetical protein [Acidipila rosea]MBW4046345.1 hypothetical protein [Acidobacteriota bacterium]TCK70812.1 hypothetical protein C7378_3201 [Acidipila rosea]